MTAPIQWLNMPLKETAKFSMFHIAKQGFWRKYEEYKVGLAKPLVKRWFQKRCKLGTPSSMLGNALISLPTCGGRSTGLVERPVSWNWGDFRMAKYGADAVCAHEGPYHFILNSWGTLHKSQYVIIPSNLVYYRSSIMLYWLMTYWTSQVNQ